VELINIHTKYPGLKSRKGIFKWPILIEKQDFNHNPKNYEIEGLFKDFLGKKPEELFYSLNSFE
jgi:hypothetical protein